MVSPTPLHARDLPPLRQGQTPAWGVDILPAWHGGQFYTWFPGCGAGDKDVGAHNLPRQRGKDLSRDPVSAGTKLQPDPTGIWSMKRTPESMPTLKRGLASSMP